MLTKDQFIEEIEKALDMFSGGHIVEAFETLCDLGHSPSEAIGMMLTHDPDAYAEYKYQLNGVK